jgi:hypothetical protein
MVLHRHLRAIDDNVLLSSRLNESSLASPGDTFIPEDQIRQHFNHVPEALWNSAFLDNNCRFPFDFQG